MTEFKKAFIMGCGLTFGSIVTEVSILAFIDTLKKTKWYKEQFETQQCNNQ